MGLNLKLNVNGKECCCFDNMDPTVIIKLHSIVSGKDLFELQKDFNYLTKKNADGSVSMNLPDAFLKELNSLSSIRFKTAVQEWLSSTEVKMNAYSYGDCEEYLKHLKDCILKG